MQVDWGLIVLIGIGVVGVLQWIKARAPNTPSWIWWVVAPVLALGLSLSAHLASPWIVVGIAGLALAQLGYEAIVEGVPTLIKSIIEKKVP